MCGEIKAYLGILIRLLIELIIYSNDVLITFASSSIESRYITGR